MTRHMDDSTTMLETLAIAEPVTADDSAQWRERSRAVLPMFPVAPGITALPLFGQHTSLWMM